MDINLFFKKSGHLVFFKPWKKFVGDEIESERESLVLPWMRCSSEQKISFNYSSIHILFKTSTEVLYLLKKRVSITRILL